jgi:hypothetical protein
MVLVCTALYLILIQQTIIFHIEAYFFGNDASRKNYGNNQETHFNKQRKCLENEKKQE